MNSHDLPVLPDCQAALTAIEADPLALPRDVLAHLRTCPACSEARVMWLAQEDIPVAMAPAGYFDRLPERIHRKLPARARHPSHMLWAAAALLIGAAALGGFWAGRLNRTPALEAKTQKLELDMQDVSSEVPFRERDDVMLQLQNMSPEEAKTLMERLQQPPSSTVPASKAPR